MKVLLLDQWLPKQTYALELCRPLGRLVSLTVMTNRYYIPQKEPFHCKSVLESEVKKKRLGFLSYLRGLLCMYGAALFGRYDALHVQVFKKQALEMPAFTLACRFTKKKLIYTAHNILPHEGASAKETEALKKWYQLCDAVIVHNEHSKQVLLDFAPAIADKIHVIPHGTYDDFSSFAKPIPHEKTVFLQFGMIRKYKGVENVMKAASLLPPEYREKIKIIIAGNQRKDLDDTDYQAILDGLGVQDVVEFLPQRVPDEQVPDYFNRADCCLFPYKEIYGSGALLMAYSFEKPVIASAIPTFAEETDNGKTGLLYDPKEERGLAEAMMRFADLSETEKDEMKRSIRNLCEAKYNWTVSARSLADVYQTVVQG